jgi:type I restriction enzyme M protein
MNHGEIVSSGAFYRYTPPRPFEAIEADIRDIEGDIVRMVAEITGWGIEAPLINVGTCI